MGKPCPASKKAQQEKAKAPSMDKIQIKEEELSKSEDSDSSDCFEVVTPSRRVSGRASKPVLKKVKYTADNSEEDESEKSSEEDDDSESEDLPRKGAKGRGKAKAPAAKKSAPKAKKAPAKNAKKPAAKKGKGKEKEKDNSDDDYESVDDDDDDGSGSDTGKKKKKSSPKKTSAPMAYNKDDDDAVDYESFQLDDDDEKDELANWKAPNYKDKEWFKKNCLICQICKKMHDTTGEALKCFHKHKDRLRCYMCFWIIKGGKNGTKRLYRHYQRHHEKGDKPNSNRCPHCHETFPYKSTSCHIISTHFREALGLPEKPPQQAAAATGGGDSNNASPAPASKKPAAKPKISLKNKKKHSDDDESDSGSGSDDDVEVKSEPESGSEEESD